MKLPIIKVLYDRRKIASKTRKGHLEIQVTIAGQRKFYALGITLYPHQWSDTQWVIYSFEAPALNQQIADILTDVREHCLTHQRNNIPINFSDITKIIKGGATQTISFIDFIEDIIDHRQDIAPTTRKQHFVLLNTLQEFGKITTFNDLTKRNIMEFDDYLHQQKKLTQTSIHSYHKRLKVYINQAIKREFIKESPYNNLSFDKGKSQTRRFLTPEEIEKIKQAPLPTESLEAVRDLFLFQCYTGLAYADLSNFDFKKDVQQEQGRYFVKKTRQKTEEQYTIYLLPPALKILNKYNNELPLLSNQKYNLYLKALSQHAGIKQKITSHVGRHSFAVFALNSGVPIEVLAKMMGHTDIKTTQVYAKILNSSIQQAFDKMAECT